MKGRYGMKKKFLFMALVLSSLSLSACGTETKTASDNAVVSEAEENTGADEKETEELLEETTEEPEKPKYEPVIALSYEGKEFDISNGTYKDLQAFFQAIGHPATSDPSRNDELEPYFEDSYREHDFDVTAGNGTRAISVRVYNPTGERIKVMDSKIEELWIGGIIKNEEFSEDILVCGVSFKDFRDWVSSSKFEELGYQRNGSEFVKVLDDGRQVIYDENNDILIITPLFEYEID
jgi:hypothetical protein